MPTDQGRSADRFDQAVPVYKWSDQGEGHAGSCGHQSMSRGATKQTLLISLPSSFKPQTVALRANEELTRSGLVDKIADGERLAEWSKPSMRVKRARAPV